MALFLRVQTKERAREGEEAGKERRDCPMLVGMVTWPGEREPGRRGRGRGGGVLLSQGSSLSAASLSPTIPCRLKRIITALWVAVEEQGSPHLHIKDTMYSAVNTHNTVSSLECSAFLQPSFSLPWQHVTSYWFLLETST